MTPDADAAHLPRVDNADEEEEEEEEKEKEEEIRRIRADVSVLRRAHGANHPAVAAAHCAIGSSCLKYGSRRRGSRLLKYGGHRRVFGIDRNEEAVEAFQEALRVFTSRGVDVGDVALKEGSGIDPTNMGMEAEGGKERNDQEDCPDDEIDSSPKIIGWHERLGDACNAGAALHNLHVAYKRLGRIDDAVACEARSVTLYRDCLDRLAKKTSGGRRCRNSGRRHEQRTDGDVLVCLELRIAQSLRSLARLRVRQGDDAAIDDAASFHEEAVSLLEGLDDDDDDDNDDDYEGDSTDGDDSSSWQRKRRTRRLPSPPGTVLLELGTVSFVTAAERERMRAVSASLNDLALLYERRGDDDDASGAYEEALAVLGPVVKGGIVSGAEADKKDHEGRTVCGNDNDDDATIDLRHDLASTLVSFGSYHLRRADLDSALHALSSAWRIRLSIYGGGDDVYEDMGGNEGSGADHPKVVAALNYVGVVHERRGELDEAMLCYEHVYQARLRTLGNDHPHLASTLNNISNLLQRQGDLEGALRLNSEALRIFRTADAKAKVFLSMEEHLGEDGDNSSFSSSSSAAAAAPCHLQIAETLQNRGSLHLRRGYLAEATECYRDALEVKSMALGPSHPDVAWTFDVLGCIYTEQESFEDARECFRASLRLYQRIGLGEDHPSISSALLNIEDINQEIALRLKSDLARKEDSDESPSHIPLETDDVFEDKKVEDEGNSCVDDTGGKDRFAQTIQSLERESSCSALGQRVTTDNHGLDGIQYVALRAFSGDESVSQLTFHVKDTISVKRDQKGDWWWGSTNNTEGWFPSAYVSKVANVFEEFLSDEPKKEQLPSVSDIPGDVKLPDDSRAAVEHRSHYSTGGAALESSSLNPSAQGVEVSDLSKLQVSEVDYPDLPAGTSSLASQDMSHKEVVGMDDLLGQMNVVHCEMDESETARPFSEVLKVERNKDDTEGVGQCLSPSNISINGNKKANKKKSMGADEAEVRAYTDTLRDQKETLGAEHPDVAKTLTTIAQLYYQRGEVIKAGKLYAEALRIQRAALGESLEVSVTLKLLGDVHKERKELNSAIKYYSEAIEMETAVLGDSLPQTLNSLGVVHLEEGDFDAAMECHQRALKLLADTLGDIQNPEVSQTLVNIGAVYYKERNSLTKIRSKDDDYTIFIESGMLGRIANAHDMRGEFVLAMQFYEEMLQLLRNRGGKSSIEEIPLTLNSLGNLNRETGRYIEALDFHQQALHAQKSLPLSKVMSAETCVLIGMVKLQTGHFNTALNMFESALPTLRSALGNNHHSVAKTVYNIGAVHAELYDFERAMSLFEEALKIQTASLEENHPETLETRVQIGRIHTTNGEFDTALKVLTEVLVAQKFFFGKDHPQIAETLQFIGDAHVGKGQLFAALRNLEESYKMRTKLLGIDHPEVATTLNSIAMIHAQNGRHEKALLVFQDALRIRKEALGNAHIDVGRLLANEGLSLAELQKLDSAMDKFEQALKIVEASVGRDHPSVADVHVHIGNVYLRKCSFEEAKAELNAALHIFRSSKLAVDHPKIVSTEDAISRVNHEEKLCV